MLLLYIASGIAIAIVLGLVISSMSKKKKDKSEQRAATVGGANVTNDLSRVFTGGVFEVPPFGTQLSSIQTYVKNRHRYSDGEMSWYELACDYEGRQLNVEWEREGQSISVAVGFDDENPTLEALGLTEKHLADMDESEGGTFQWDSVTWKYANSEELSFFENSGDEEETFYGWDFQTENGERFISIEKWPGDAQFYVYATYAIDPKKIEVFDGGAGS